MSNHLDLKGLTDIELAQVIFKIMLIKASREKGVTSS